MSVFLDTSKRRKFYFRGATAFFIFALFGAVLVFLFGFSFYSSVRSPVAYSDASERYHYYYSAANDKKVALTIDDGPHAPATEHLLSMLALHNAPATFFYIGEHAFARPDLVKKVAEAGFDVEVHSFTHSPDTHSSYTRLSTELHSTGYLLSQITGTPTTLYRPPFLLGIGVDPTVNPYIEPPKDVLWSLEAGYLPVGSDIDPKDWLATSTQGVLAGLERALQENPNGHIVLLHEDMTTARAIGDIVTYLRDQGYTIVPLKDLLTPPTSIALASTLRLGDTDRSTGGDVSKLQWFLYKNKYLDPYELTGVFDEQTKGALANFQAHNGISDPNNPDPLIAGIAGPATRALIEKISTSNIPAQNGTLFVESKNILSAVMGSVEDVARTVYVQAFPVFKGWLVVLIFLSLLLVLGRSLGLVSLIVWSKIYKTPTVPLITQGHPGVAVLIPAYNEEENIAGTVESIVKSPYPRKEIIVIDDGSSDNTSAEVEGVIRRYPTHAIRLVRVENGGKARALNIGLEYAQYEIVVVVDADAVLHQDALAHFVKHFVDERVGAVAGRVCTTGSTRLLDLFQKLEYAIGQNIDKRAFSVVGAVGVVPGPAGAWRRNTLLSLGGFSVDTLAEDQDMTLTVLRSGMKIVYEPDAVAYTETPHTIKNFLKQRFRWVYGTMQCFWKHKGAYREEKGTALTLVVLPNVFIFNIVLPLLYPFADSALLIGLFVGDWRSLVLPFLAFTAFDLMYALWGVWKEPHAWKLMLAVPLQRVVYRQLLYYSVIKSVVRAIEGTGSGWNKFAKSGETKKFFLTSIATLAESGAVPEKKKTDNEPEMLPTASTSAEPVTLAPITTSMMQPLLTTAFEDTQISR